MAMADIIKRNQIRSEAQFARSVGLIPQNLNLVMNQGQNVSLLTIEAICRVYRVNPTFIILGEGRMYLPRAK